MEYIKFRPLRDKFKSVAWYLGSVCNYSCSYCIPEFHDGKQKFPDYGSFIRFINKIQEKYPNEKIMITLIGGEVTLWKQFKSFLQEWKDNEVYVRIISNGSRSIEWWKTVIDMLDYIVISYHTEFASEEHITELLKLINKKGHLSFMIPPKVFDESVKIARRISKNSQAFVIPKFLRKNFSSELYPYTQEQLDFFKKPPIGSNFLDQGRFRYQGLEMQTSDGKIIHWSNARKIFLNKLNIWKGWKCWGGLDAFFVDWGGDICVGQCRRGKFANINDEEYELPNEPFICDKDICNCTQDIIETRKEKVL